MTTDPAAHVAAAIHALAEADGTPVSVRHVCQACVSLVHADGASLYVAGDLGLAEPVCAIGSVGDQVAELQITLGEGPTIQSLDEERMTLIADLASGQPAQRWPMFTPAALRAGVAAVFAFPLAMGAISVGVLELYRHAPGVLTLDEVRDGLLFADAALLLVLDRVGDLPTAGEHDLFAEGPVLRWTRIHQAVGRISVQLDTDPTTAYLRLRAYAFLTGERLSDLAQEVLEGRLRLSP